MQAIVKTITGACLLAAGTLITSHAGATTITFADFSSVAGLTINGDAAQVGNVLRLTPATVGQSGSAFSTSSITLSDAHSFSTFFKFRISNPGGISDNDGVGADGLVFVVQTNANDVGGSGGGIGYLGIPNSVGVEFDTWNNGPSFSDFNGNHVGIDLGGNIASVVHTPFATRLNDGDIWNAWVDYNGATDALEVRLSASATRPATALLTHTVDLSTVLGAQNAFVGFTSGTGSAFGDHDILSWEFRDTFNPIVTPPGTPNGTVPLPGMLSLLAIGLFGIGTFRSLRG